MRLRLPLPVLAAKAASDGIFMVWRKCKVCYADEDDDEQAKQDEEGGSRYWNCGDDVSDGVWQLLRRSSHVCIWRAGRTRIWGGTGNGRDDDGYAVCGVGQVTGGGGV